jgi:endonuclease YncB( thermonuclease family)
VRPAFGLLLGLGTIAAAAIGWAPEFGSAGQAAAALPSAMVEGAVRVRDGDTIVVGGTPVRLSGLHCPELRERGGRAAAEAMRGLVGRAPVRCALTGARTHDREVGMCHAGGLDLAEALIRDGRCARCARFDPAGRYHAAQSAAGPWGAPLPRYCS